LLEPLGRAAPRACYQRAQRQRAQDFVAGGRRARAGLFVLFKPRVALHRARQERREEFSREQALDDLTLSLQTTAALILRSMRA
jgi:hypothetical protein